MKFSIFDINKQKMIVERTKDEIVVRLPANIDLSELQNMLDYLKYRELTADSKASQENADQLADEVNSKIWDTIISASDRTIRDSSDQLALTCLPATKARLTI